MSLTDENVRSSELTIKEHVRNYYTLLKEAKEFLISDLFNLYKRSHPSLHQKNDSDQIDVSVLSYCLPRLPEKLFKTKKIIICQNTDQLKDLGIDITGWESVSAPARRRLNYYDRLNQTLVVMITSDSDIDDFINCLISFQIERIKFSLLSLNDLNQLLNSENYHLLNIDSGEWIKLKENFGNNWKDNLNLYAQYFDIAIRSTLNDTRLYESIYSEWWHKISTSSLVFELSHAPIYFVSSNLHSLSNLSGGYVNQIQDKIIIYIEKSHPDLYLEWQNIKNGHNQLRVLDFLYYISSKYFSELPKDLSAKTIYEEGLGIKTIKSSSNLQCNAQLIPVASIAKSIYKDPNLIIKNQSLLEKSRAYILNIDYPLGFSGYFLLKELLLSLNKLLGIYIVGKAAILSGKVGDIQIPKIVFDERTNNIFYPKNVFNNNYFFSALQSAILTDQKSISVYGTYLENETQLKNYINSGFNIIEMETGPYLTAIYQHVSKLMTTPHNTVAHLDDLPFELGIINYASDNPLSQNLGEGSLSLKGIEPTYLAALSVLQRIIDLESA